MPRTGPLQLAYDLRFPGVTMFYSWPSAARTAGYLHDVESTQLATGIFDKLLDDLSALNFEDIYIVAHSMGNRVVGGALANRVRDGRDVSKLREIMLAAPDINVEIFRSEIAPRLAGIVTARKTIYASSRHIALKASSVVHDFPRVGDTKSGVFIHSGFDTIDASGAAPLMRAFGHSYVLDSAVVLNDRGRCLNWRRPLSERILMPLGIRSQPILELAIQPPRADLMPRSGCKKEDRMRLVASRLAILAALLLGLIPSALVASDDPLDVAKRRAERVGEAKGPQQSRHRRRLAALWRPRSATGSRRRRSR